MHRRRADANQAKIVADLRGMGASVVVLAGVGFGVPDLLIGWAGKSYLAEIKNAAGRDRFTPAELEFIQTWCGSPVIVAHTIDDILREL